MMNLKMKILFNKLCIFIINVLIKISDKFKSILQHYRDMVENIDYLKDDTQATQGKPNNIV